jgi:hypothetical protein
MPIENIVILVWDHIYTAKVIKNPQMNNTQGISLGNTVIPLRGNFKNKGAICVTTRKSGVPLLIPDEDKDNMVLFKSKDDRSIYIGEKRLKPFCVVMNWEIYNLTKDEYDVILGKKKKGRDEIQSEESKVESSEVES